MMFLSDLGVFEAEIGAWGVPMVEITEKSVLLYNLQKTHGRALECACHA